MHIIEAVTKLIPVFFPAEAGVTKVVYTLTDRQHEARSKTPNKLYSANAAYTAKSFDGYVVMCASIKRKCI